jgi:CRISPR-associated protein Csm3
MQLIGKIFIKGSIVAETGLHIGGSKSSLDIGGIDLNVIKTANKVPFIPGSSLKGKLRSMLARLEGSESAEKDKPYIKTLFGDSGGNDKENDNNPKKNYEKGAVTRLIVRDAMLADKENFKKRFKDLEFEYTETKWENTIDRKTGTAQHPRQLERVPAGAKFEFEIVYDEYDDNQTKEHLTTIRTAMRLLEGDYLGGSGSRGYGKVRFEGVNYSIKRVSDFQGANQAQSYDFKY